MLALLLLLLFVVAAGAWQTISQRRAEQWRQSATLAQLTEAVRHSHDDADLSRRLGLRQREAGQLTQAEQSFQQAVQLKPDDEALWQEWAATVGASRGAAAQMLVLTAWQKSLPQSGRVRAEIARLQYLAGNYGVSEKLAREATSLNPDHSEGWQILGQLALIRQDLTGARNAFEQARIKDPNRWESYLGLTKVALLKADGAAALQAAREMSKRAPDEPVARLYLARALLQRPQGQVSDADVAEARQLLTSALNRASGLVGESRFDALVALGDSYADRAAWDEAAIWFEEAQKAAPGSVKLQVRLMRAYKEIGQPEKENAVRLRYKASAAYQESAQTLRLKIAAFPGDGSLRLQLARLYARNGNYVDAARTYQLMIAQGMRAGDARREYAALAAKTRL